MLLLSLAALFVTAAALSYWLLLMLGAVRGSRHPSPSERPTTSFIIAIAAHDEEDVIGDTVRCLLALDYPSELYAIHVVADHCSDRTAAIAHRAGAIVHIRNEGPRTGKGAALGWLFQRVLDAPACDAVAVFDADTRVDKQFLRAVESRLSGGAQVVQGRHVISNPDAGWFPALTWAMFMIDNRFQNLGRANLGWSAKHMGDSICLRAAVLRRLGWGDGLTDDYEFRQRLLLNGVRIAYEPGAIGYGEAPATLGQASSQRSRWIVGVHTANRRYARKLLAAALRTGDVALVDGALQAYAPSYSVLAASTAAICALHLLWMWGFGGIVPQPLAMGWATALGLLLVYPFVGLMLEKAPAKAYAVIATGPCFVIWRMWLTVRDRLGTRTTIWIRTAHKGTS